MVRQFACHRQGLLGRGFTIALAGSLALSGLRLSAAPVVPDKREAPGGLAVTTDPADAEVYVDGELAGQTPLTVSGLSAGDHRVRLSKAGYVENGRVVTIAPGKETTVQARLSARVSEAAAPAAAAAASSSHTWLWIAIAGGAAGAAAALTLGKNKPPNPGTIALSVTTAFVNDSVTFTSQGASDPDNDTLTFAWDFGDGATGSGISTTHAYATAGSFTVTLTVSDGKANPTTTGSVTIKNITPPIPGTITATPNSVNLNQTVSFSITGASDPDGRPLTFSWNFGDGGTGTGASPTHAYALLGTFTVTMTVNDTRASATATTTVTVKTVTPPNAGSITGASTIAIIGTTVTLTSTGASDPAGLPLTFSWNFGDGATAIGTSVTHAYSAAGTFNVTLTVSNGTASAVAPAAVTVKSLVATWKGTIAAFGLAVTFVVTNQTGTTISGTYSDSDGPGTFTGTINAATRLVTMTVNQSPFLPFSFSGTPSADINSISGTMLSQPLVLTRQ